jgi:hypothetical protein
MMLGSAYCFDLLVLDLHFGVIATLRTLSPSLFMELKAALEKGDRVWWELGFQYVNTVSDHSDVTDCMQSWKTTDVCPTVRFLD